jgi:uncharacterized protein (DUF1800 family)
MSTQGERFTGAAAGLTPQQRARIAAFRFGMGPKPGLIEKLSRSRDAAFQACWDELTGPSARATAMIPPLHVGGVQLTEEQDAERYLSAVGITDAATHERRNEELGRRYAKHMEPELGFVERLVLFWANHFSMHQFRTWRTRISLGHFERAVIRKNVLGSFPQMLVDAISHTALIDYLDNNRNTRRNLNENLARETLELYTLGTAERYPGRAQDYTQADVESLTRILTGWNINHDGASSRNGQFQFREHFHDEGAHELMGQTFSAAGQAKGLDALNWLAMHPNTAQNIATKLLRHFVTDNPPEAMVQKLQKAYLDHDGSLLEVAKCLLQMEEAWASPMRLRQPFLWIVAQARALGFGAEHFLQPAQVNAWQNRAYALNHAAWSRLTPDGYPDRDSDWLHPDAMRMRPIVAVQVLIDAHNRGWALPDPDTLRQQLLPGSVRVTPAGSHKGIHAQRAAIADIFLTTEFMSR